MPSSVAGSCVAQTAVVQNLVSNFNLSPKWSVLPPPSGFLEWGNERGSSYCTCAVGCLLVTGIGTTGLIVHSARDYHYGEKANSGPFRG